ncbi:MAG: amidohydrolase family protein [Clostridiales bacterium]|nr:amidohydrolase family protein [Clostridiales bacterium]
MKKNIYVSGEKIASISDAVFPAAKTIDAENLKVLPGLIDPHVHLHLNIGQTYSADDFLSGSQLAVSGGVTTLIDFLDPIYNNDELKEVFDRRLKEADNCVVDFAFHCTLGNYQDDIDELAHEVNQLGITSIKVFTTYSDSNRRCSEDNIKKLLNTELLVLAHSEDDKMILPCDDIKKYEQSRSEASEWSAVNRLIEILKISSGKLYIVHISSGHTLEKMELLPGKLFLESCPQYFHLNKSLFLNPDGRKYLLAPPIRSLESIRLMKRNLRKLDTIGTDHCPFMLDEKYATHLIDMIPKGIGSLGLAFPLMYELFGSEIITKFTENPARIFGLHQKGKLEKGMDADFAILDDQLYTLPNSIFTKCDYSVYDHPVKSKVVMTILRGDVVMEKDHLHTKKGLYLRRHHEGHN